MFFNTIVEAKNDFSNDDKFFDDYFEIIIYDELF